MNSIDFLPERIAKQRARRRRLRRQVYLLALAVAGMAILGYFRQGQIREARAELQVLKNSSEGAKQQLKLRQALERQQADLTAMERIENELGSRAGVLDVLAELQKVMPDNVALTDLTLESTEVPAAAGSSAKMNQAAKPDGAKDAKAVNRLRATISGVSPTDVDVANFIGQLSASRLFEDVNMGYARSVDFRGRKAREFQVSCYISR